MVWFHDFPRIQNESDSSHRKSFANTFPIFQNEFSRSLANFLAKLLHRETNHQYWIQTLQCFDFSSAESVRLISSVPGTHSVFPNAFVIGKDRLTFSVKSSLEIDGSNQWTTPRALHVDLDYHKNQICLFVNPLQRKESSRGAEKSKERSSRKRDEMPLFDVDSPRSLLGIIENRFFCLRFPSLYRKVKSKGRGNRPRIY